MPHFSHLPHGQDHFEVKTSYCEEHRTALPDTLLDFRLCSTDGGEYSSEYRCDNVFVKDSSCYCSLKRDNVNIVARCTKDRPYYLTSLEVAAPAEGYTSPVGQGLLFCCWERPTEEFLERTKKWDGIRDEKELQYMLDLKRAQGQPLEDSDPVMCFDLKRRNWGHFLLDKPRSGYFVVVKLLRSRSIGGGNIDIQFIGLRGWDRPQAFSTGSYC